MSNIESQLQKSVLEKIQESERNASIVPILATRIVCVRPRMRLAIKDILRLKAEPQAKRAGRNNWHLTRRHAASRFGNCLGPRAALAVLMSFSAWVVTDPAAGNIPKEPKPKAVHRRFLKFPLEYRITNVEVKTSRYVFCQLQKSGQVFDGNGVEQQLISAIGSPISMSNPTKRTRNDAPWSRARERALASESKRTTHHGGVRYQHGEWSAYSRSLKLALMRGSMGLWEKRGGSRARLGRGWGAAGSPPRSGVRILGLWYGKIQRDVLARCRCPAVPLSGCLAAPLPLSCCPAVLLSRCRAALLPRCRCPAAAVLLSGCPAVPLSCCPLVLADRDRSVVVAVVFVGVVEMALHEVVGMIAMRYRFMSAPFAVAVIRFVSFAFVPGSATNGVRGVHSKRFFVVVIAVWEMKMSLVEIPCPVLVFDCRVTTAWAMYVSVGFVDRMLAVAHTSPAVEFPGDDSRPLFRHNSLCRVK